MRRDSRPSACVDEPTRTVATAFAAGHVWLTDRLDTMNAELAHGNREGAARVFRNFSRRLRRHLRAEELYLFAPVERFGGAAERTLIRALRVDHAVIESLVDLVESRLSQERGIREALNGLGAALARHELEEQRTLFPACERLLTVEACAEAVRALEDSTPLD